MADLTPASLSFRRDRRSQVKCKPPNRRCGDRCIPPGWNCRLTGEGDDGHLKAVGKNSDPVAGLANIERGVKRLGKAATKLSFSELEGARRAFARGAAKLSPGDMQKKKEVQEQVYRWGLLIGTPIAFAISGALVHTGLKVFPGYRRGWGAQIDQSASNALYQVSRNVPFYGEGVRQREVMGPRAVQSYLRTQRAMTSGSPAVLERRASTGSALQRISEARRLSGDVRGGDGYSAIADQLRSVDKIGGKASKRGFAEWEPKSLEAYWKTPRPNTMGPDYLPKGPETSVFSVPAANDLLSRSFGYTLPRGIPTASQTNRLVSHMTSELRQTGLSIRTSMETMGMDPNNPEVVGKYLRAIPLQQRVPKIAEDSFFETLTTAVTERNHAKQARDLYRTTVENYDSFFRQVATNVTAPAGIADPANSRMRSFYNDGILAHSQVLAERMRFPGRVEGPGSAILVRKAYHNVKVMADNRPNYRAHVVLTPTEAATAAAELARSRNLPEPATAQEAIQLLNHAYGNGNKNDKDRLGSIGLVRSPNATRSFSTLRSTGTTRDARRRSSAQRLADIRRERNADGSLRYPSLEAAQAELERRTRRGDELRADYTPTEKRKGKPCGKSFVGRNAKCSKPTTARYADPKRDPKSVSPETAAKVGAAAVGAIALVAGGRAAYMKRAQIKGAFKTGKGIIKSERAAYGKLVRSKMRERNSYGGRKYTRANAQRAAQREYMATRQRALIPEISKYAVEQLSTEDVRRGLDSLPKHLQPQARNLVGHAKNYAARAGLEAQGMKMVSVTEKHNFATYRDPETGYVASVGSVGDSLLIYGTQKRGELKGVAKYGMSFKVDNSYSQRKGLAKEQSAGIASATKAMFQDHIDQLPNNAFIINTPFKDDGLGKKREAVYRRWGFTKLPRGNEMWAMKDEGKFRKLSEPELESLMKILQGREDALERWRADKKCGKSGVANNKKCRKPPSQVVGEALRSLGTGVAVAGGGAAIGMFLNSRQGRRIAERVATQAMTVSKRPLPPGKSSKEWFDNMTFMPGMHEGHRQRRYEANIKMRAIKADEFAAKLSSLGSASPERAKVAQLIKKLNVELNPKMLDEVIDNPRLPQQSREGLATMREQLRENPQLEGFYLDPYHPSMNRASEPNKIYINYRRGSDAEWKPSKKGVSDAMSEFRVARELSPKSAAELQKNLTRQNTEAFAQSFTTYGAAKGDERDLLLAVHETGHLFDVGFSRRQRPTEWTGRGGKPARIDSPEFELQARKVTSHYGLSDFDTTKDEFFAETFVLYTADSAMLRSDAPLLYTWVDTYLDQMLEKA